MPVEILGFQIERKTVGQDAVQRRRNIADGFVRQIGRRIEPRIGFAVGIQRSNFAHGHGGVSLRSEMGAKRHHPTHKGRHLFLMAPGAGLIRIRHIMEYFYSAALGYQWQLDKIAAK
jgi:hypothetical protein